VGKKTKTETLYPDLEVVVRRGAHEICTIAFFPDEWGGLDILVGLESLDDRELLETTFKHSAVAVKDAVAVARASDDDVGGLPF